MNLLLKIVLLVGLCTPSFCGSSSKDAVKLRDVEVLTLYHGKMTNGRRSSPVPQLKCVGGTAGCKSFIPKVVQCYNRGWDGYDVNWECKTEMDNAFQFGKIAVSCEGYSYPDDPYILKGSCGLEYTIDLTDGGSGNRASYDDSGNGSGFASLLFFGILALVIYALYKTCLEPTAESVFQSSTSNDDFGGYPGGNPYTASAPPPPGFRPDVTNDSATFGASCGRQQSGSSGNAPRTGAGGFWTGAAVGGMLGYMFGNRNSSTTRTYSSRENVGSSPNSNQFWGGNSRRSSWSSSGHGSGSSGTRTTSGFGGTTRR